MYVTAQEFVNLWTTQWGTSTDLSSYLSSTKTLVKKYGASLQNDEIRGVVEKYDASLAWFIKLLWSINKCNVKSLTDIAWLVGKNDSDKEITIRTSHKDRVWSLSEWASVVEQQSVGLMVEWWWNQWWIY